MPWRLLQVLISAVLTSRAAHTARRLFAELGNPKPTTSNLQPQTSNPKPKTYNPKPQTANRKPQT
jgi:hypothetical protein